MLQDIVIVAVLGLAMGSFLTLLVERFDSLASAITGRSHCNHCKQTLRWWELLPFISYIVLRGRCSRCNKQIPIIYPVFEAIASGAFVLTYLAAPQPFSLTIFTLELLFVSLLLFLLFFDWLHQAFPANVLYAGFGAVLLLQLAKFTTGHPLPTFGLLEAWEVTEVVSLPSLSMQLLLGALVGGVSLGILALPTRGTWMGYGDVILAALLGLWVGYPLIIVTLVLAFYIGAIVSLALLVTRQVKKDHRIAFGPFLILSALIAQAWGQHLFVTIMNLWGIS